jgi:hypothetical protein
MRHSVVGDGISAYKYIPGGDPETAEVHGSGVLKLDDLSWKYIHEDAGYPKSRGMIISPMEATSMITNG